MNEIGSSVVVENQKGVIKDIDVDPDKVEADLFKVRLDDGQLCWRYETDFQESV